jgi:hypothetical protein
MVRASITVCVLAAAACASLAQSTTPVPRDTVVRISMPQSQLVDIIEFYQTLTRRRTWIDAQLRFDHPIDLVSQRDMPRDEAVQFIRDTLRKEGIEIREVGDSEAYVSRAAP